MAMIWGALGPPELGEPEEAGFPQESGADPPGAMGGAICMPGSPEGDLLGEFGAMPVPFPFLELEGDMEDW